MKKSIKNIERLAEQRTKLAVERTYLSHLRTASASAIFGFGILELFPSKFSQLISAFFITLSLLFIIIGTYTYIKRRSSL